MKRILPSIGKALLLLAVLAAAALPAVYTDSVYGYLPALALFTLFLLSFLCLLRLRNCVRVETGAGNVECARGGSVALGLRVANRSRLPCPEAEARLAISDLFGQSDSERLLRFPVGGRGEVALDLDLDMAHVGMYSVGLTRLTLCDFFGIVRLRVPASGELTALVTPRLRPVEDFQLSGAETVEASRDTRVAVVGGTDYTGVREYALGDPMKQIHWKLSAHSRAYVTKLQESFRHQEYAVVLDFAAEPLSDRETLMQLNDCLIETALSLADTLARQDAGFALLYAARGGGVGRSVIAGADRFPELLRSFAFLTPGPGPAFPDAAAILRQEGQTQNRAANVLVVTSRVTEELLREMQSVKRQRRAPELFYVVPAAWTERDRESAAAKMRTLDEMEIPRYFVSTSENFKE